MLVLMLFVCSTQKKKKNFPAFSKTDCNGVIVNLNLLLSVSSVGKTSLITRFMYDSFDNTYQVRELHLKEAHWRLLLQSTSDDLLGSG